MKFKLSIFFVLICVNSWLHTTTWYIKQDGTGNFTTIQEGINASADSDTVLVYPGTYYENLDLNGHNITLASLELTTGDEQYISSTIIDGQRLLSCIEIQDITIGATIRGFTIQNGYGTEIQGSVGGGIFMQCAENTNITNCYLKDNVATLGGGILAILSDLTLSGLDIIHNSAGYGGGIFFWSNYEIDFDAENRCNIYNNNAGKGADLFSMESEQIDVIVDTFSVFEPSRYFAEYLEGSTYTFDIQNNWMELVPHDLYVHPSGDDENSGSTPDEPLKNISWAVRRIQADSLNPRTVHVAAGYYSHLINGQIFPIGCKEYVSIIGADMDNTILINDYNPNAVIGHNLNGVIGITNFSIQNDPERYTSNVMMLRYIDKLKLENIKIQNNSNIRFIFTNSYIYNEYNNLNIINNVADDTNSGLGLHRNAGYMKNCIISNNENIEPDPFSNEVAMQLSADGDFLLENCIFSGNHSTNNEGRIIRTTNVNGNEPTITFNNCLISDNSIGSRYVFQNFNYDGLTEFNNCTFSNNIASSNFYPSTIYSKGDVNITNTIMHNNTDYEIFMADDTINGYNYLLNVEHSNIKNGEDGVYNMNNANIINWLEGNIGGDPLFLLSGEDPYQLTGSSPCIDSGTPDTTGLFLPPWDLLHNERIWDGNDDGTAIIDMGCYEFGADSVSVTENPIPNTQYLLTNYPNPFNPETKIVFELPESGQVKLEIYNIKGQKVKTLLDCYMSPGRSEMLWNSRDDNNKRVSSGVYFYKLQTDDKIVTKKMLLLK
ncbi:MAG: T9SS type A sorting domain-containing protein [Candidatus Cloacimonetes bacterium]|nr:T9SS type A sorting domain-containing protein [Candidatus Cloacimonadota bacterium]